MSWWPIALESLSDSYQCFGKSKLMFALYGKGCGRGMGIGQCCVIPQMELPRAYEQSNRKPRQEWAVFLGALKACIQQLEHMADPRDVQTTEGAQQLLQAQLLILQDPSFRDGVAALIMKQRYRAASATLIYTAEVVRKLGQRSQADAFEIGADQIQQAGNFVAEACGKPPLMPDDLSGKVLVVNDLSLTHAIRLRSMHLEGLVLTQGSITSHSAILAHSMRIPTLVGLGEEMSLIQEDELLIVDEAAGALIVNPVPSILSTYQQRKAHVTRTAERITQPALVQTLDGVKVELLANIEWVEDIHQLCESGASGIGLFRTEFLFMAKDTPPLEEEQYQIYKQAAECGLNAVTIRVFDLGGDKVPSYLKEIGDETDSFLRGIRYGLQKPELLLTQLRALLRAAACGPLRLLLPMVRDAEEVQHTRRLLKRASAQLSAEKIAHRAELPIGGMLEVPVSSLCVDLFAETLDFFAVGTNDLVPELMHTRRSESDRDPLLEALHPGVIRTLSTAVATAQRYQRPIYFCGQLAATERFSRILLAMGVTQLSMDIEDLSEARRWIEQTHTQELKQKMGALLASQNFEQWYQRLKDMV